MVTTVAPLPPSLNPAVRVNIRLCGSVPRNELGGLSLGKRVSHHELCQTELLNGETFPSSRGHVAGESWGANTHDSNRRSSQHIDHETNQPSTHIRACPSLEPPVWAVPAQGDTRLEPVCETLGVQPAVDLTSRAVHYVGRSPTSDIQLVHATSSRRHAMIFHHSNGSCYVVDCSSAHGTFVNGNRVNSSSIGGSIIPHRVRQGSIIRFGGPGAPSYVLKSFDFHLSEIKDLEFAIPHVLSPSNPQLVHVVRRNTRMNSLGKSAMESISCQLGSKRSFDSVETISDNDCDAMAETQMRCTSPLLFHESPTRLVSPDICGPPTKRRRVRFSDHPPQAFYPSLISPDVSSDESDDE